MKKSLIALAALSAFATAAQAQSSVTIYGTVDVGYGQTKTTAEGVEGKSATKNGTAASAYGDATNTSLNGTHKSSSTGNGHGGLSTSIFGFRGTEDLGGGKSAVFTLEYALGDAGAGGNSWGARQSFVGLSDSKLGTVRLGRMTTASHGIITSYSAGMANNTIGAIYSAGTGISSTVNPNMLSIRPHQVFASRVVAYTSPNMGGLVVNAMYGQNKNDTVSTTDTNTKGTFTDISAKFDSGKLSLGASYQENKSQANSFDAAAIDAATGLTGYQSAAVGGVVGDGATLATSGTAIPMATGAGTIKTKTTMFGASYNFGVVQPFALYTERTLSANTAVGSTKAVANGAGQGLTVVDRALDGSTKQKAYELGARVPVSSTVMAFASMNDGDIKDVGGEGKTDLSGYQAGVTYSMSKRTTVYAITGQQKLKGEETKIKSTGTSVGLRHTF
jgi:predicted porin